MGFLSKFKRKFIPRELSKPVDEFLDFGADVVEKGITKPFASLSDKLIPNELRFLAPYAAGIGTLMLPPGMGPLMRGLAGAGFNTLGQIAADETPVEDISDLNELSMLIAGGLGSLGSQDVTTGGESGMGIRGRIESGVPPEAAMARGPAELGMTTRGPGFIQGVENLSREGIGTLSDYVQGTRSSLAGFGKDPSSLFDVKTGGNISVSYTHLTLPTTPYV